MMKKAFSLVEIMIIMAIISLIIAIAVPSFIRARRVSQARACQANLQRIDGAIEQWIMDNNQSRSNVSIESLMEAPFGDDTEAYINREWPSCPANSELYELVEGNMICPSGLLGHRIEDAAIPTSEWTLE